MHLSQNERIKMISDLIFKIENQNSETPKKHDLDLLLYETNLLIMELIESHGTKRKEDKSVDKQVQEIHNKLENNFNLDELRSAGDVIANIPLPHVMQSILLVSLLKYHK